MSHQAYYATNIEAKKTELESAEGALARDFAQGVAGAGWAAFLRDKYDVRMLIEQISEAARSRDWVATLHAAADKAREQQPSRGRPPKPTTKTSQKKPLGNTTAPTAASNA